MQKMVADAGLTDQVFCDSCGTSAHHIGDEVDPRMMEHAALRGYQLLSKSRPFTGAKDYSKFDFIFAMDRHNHQAIIEEAPDKESRKKVYMMSSFCTKHESADVPDPFYGGPAGFEKVLDLLEDACSGVLKKLSAP